MKLCCLSYKRKRLVESLMDPITRLEIEAPQSIDITPVVSEPRKPISSHTSRIPRLIDLLNFDDQDSENGEPSNQEDKSSIKHSEAHTSLSKLPPLSEKRIWFVNK